MHPRISERLSIVEVAKREELYRSLDGLLMVVSAMCEQAGVNGAAELRIQRDALARIAAADGMPTSDLLAFAVRLTERARVVAEDLNNTRAQVRPQARSRT